MGWYTSTPRFGATATVAHFFGRSRRVPICIETEAADQGGLLALTAASGTTPHCVACEAVIADACGREVRA